MSETVYADEGEPTAYAVTEDGTAFSYSLEDGSLNWRYSLHGDGFHSYPGAIIHEGLLIWPTYFPSSVDGVDNASLTRLGALDRGTGELAWVDDTREDHAYADTYCPPQMYDGAVHIFYEGAAQAFDPATGDKLWTTLYDGTNFGYGDYYLYCGAPAVDAESGTAVLPMDSVTMGLDLDNGGDVAWTIDSRGSYKNPVVADGMACVIDDSQDAVMLIDPATGDITMDVSMADYGYAAGAHTGSMYLDGGFYAYLLTSDSQPVLARIDAESGEMTTAAPLHERGGDVGTPEASAPTTDGERIYVNYRTGSVPCEVAIVDPAGGFIDTLGYSQEYDPAYAHGPVPWNGSVIVTTDEGGIWRAGP